MNEITHVKVGTPFVLLKVITGLLFIVLPSVFAHFLRSKCFRRTHGYVLLYVKMLADVETVALRLLICNEPCQYNNGGTCRRCCGGVPIGTIVRLKTSKCGAGHW